MAPPPANHCRARCRTPVSANVNAHFHKWRPSRCRKDSLSSQCVLVYFIDEQQPSELVFAGLLYDV